ncbi:ribulose-phosphate 3-epimerase [Novipirellula artificiosorum]|uniref:Ribulose-phosphate 3-epimerase n=1 Tax=Novipirellula artificiosorum TaxID=2528016 RepID=A0A5C6DVV6_9BACT|nr:ribulose-phosphate 3-epimerase [Novipirellula artificiosorum]TWU39186.1 Ribulose-phosphate 3-epimerase [Novipirellula artificiosorum]
MTRAKLDLIRKMTPAILPSVLSCDFGDMKSELARLTSAGARALHVDVMDGHFVPNLTFGMPIVAGLRRHTELPLDVHLMISDPLRYAPAMVDAGADLLTFHVEAVEDATYTAKEFRKLGVGVGVALDPETPLSDLDGCLSFVDMVLVMSVKAGFGGQPFDSVSLDKLTLLRDNHPGLLLQIDGGINAETIGPARQAGCDLFVVGSALIGRDDYSAALGELDQAVRSADATPQARVK